MARILPLIFMLGTMSCHAQLKIASVKMTELFDSFSEAQASAKQLDLERKAVEIDKRVDVLKQMMQELQNMDDVAARMAENYKSLTREEKQIEGEKIQEFVSKRNLKAEAAQSVQEEYMEFRTKRLTEINQRMARLMRQHLNKLQSMIFTYATQNGYDLITDSSGLTNTGLPVMIYSNPAKTPDITSELKAFIAASNASSIKPLDGSKTDPTPAPAPQSPPSSDAPVQESQPAAPSSTTPPAQPTPAQP
jgi:Skp family chaperone for outer membrane proteins